MAISERESAEIERANASGKLPVVFIHGLWLLPSSWDRWAAVFEEAGYAPLTPGWPDDPQTVEEARSNPDAFAGKSVEQVADHFAEAIGELREKPAIVGHSFGGLLAQILAGGGLSRASVAISPAPFRGVLPLPISALRATKPVLENPLNRNRAITLTLDQFKYGWANALSDEEARELHSTYHVPAPAKPIFEAATANLNPFTKLKVDHRNPERGPLLILWGGRDHTVPGAICKAAYGKQKHNEGVTEIEEVPNRGHSITIDGGWREVCDRALAFVKRSD